jgi:hypothetical protein
VPEFIRWIFENPLILLILVGWIISMIGNAVTKAARKQARGQRRRAGPGPGGPAQPDRAEPARPRPQARRPGAPSSGPSPEEIAREIRRVMGLEVEEPQPEPRRPAPPPPEPVEIVPDRPRTSLAEELVAKDEQRARHLGALEARRSDLGAGIRDRHLRELEVHIGARERRARRGRRAVRSPSRALRLDPIISTLVGLEVLGRPVALREARAGSPQGPLAPPGL